ncbi:Omp28-related outer membrane protein [Moheibacter sediminis]|uniref:Outer membrane protein Omp28 n=1 Tax=Moheibacter sediminis TaxID=1434700 RepID=A0A1W2CI75_9FLAO|nr:Omp28-related outer membrane protein [Moheibacter sediminis]SMC84338.1 Outer membrane protein Omp28 [Moheibacter sediminis]
MNYKKSIRFVMVLLFTFAVYSCSDDEGSGSNNTIELTSNLSETSIPFGEGKFEFTVENSQNEDITSSSTIYVNDTPIIGNEFSPTEPGTYEVYAQKDNSTSNTISLAVSEKNKFTHKVMVEDFTGTWCGYCPRVMDAFVKLSEITNKVVPIGVHSGDSFQIPEYAQLENLVPNFGGYPTAFINRSAVWSINENENLEEVTSKINANSTIGISISSQLDENNGTVSVRFAFGANYNQSLKYGIYILENGLVENQVNYYTGSNGLFGGTNPLVNFVHNHTLRGYATPNIAGKALPSGQSMYGNIIELPNLATSNYTSLDVNKLEIVVFIMDANGKVLNVQVAPANTVKGFEFL